MSDRTRRVRTLARAATATLILLAPTSAVGLSMAPNPAGWSFPSGGGETNAGFVTLVEVVAGLPLGGQVDAGSLDPGDTTLVFEVTSTSQGLPDFQVRHQAIVPEAIGHVPGAGTDVAGTGFDLAAFFEFAGGLLPAGATSDRLFVSYASPPVGEVLNFRTASDLVSLSFATVPEPPLAAAVSLAVAALTLALGRRGRIR